MESKLILKLPSRKVLRHKVMCAVCGDKAIVLIDKETGKILDKDWWYWGKIHNPNRDKYFFAVADRDDPTVSLDNPRKELNPDYNPKAPKYLMEYWEDRKCFSKTDERIKEQKKRGKKEKKAKKPWNVVCSKEFLKESKARPL